MSIEQRAYLKFLVRWDKILSEALTLLPKVYRKDVMLRSRGFEWRKRFKENRDDLEDNAKWGRSSTSRTDAIVERVKQIIRVDGRTYNFNDCG